MLRLKSVSDIRDPRFLGLYRTSFPPEEQIPPSELAGLLGRGGKLYLAFDSDVFVGFSFTFEYSDILYIAYLAVVPSLRGEGYGSDILNEIVSEGGRRGCVLSIECDDGNSVPERTARRRFYERNGWKKTPLRLLSKGTDLDIYTLDSDLSDSEILSAVRAFYNSMPRRPARLRAGGSENEFGCLRQNVISYFRGSAFFPHSLSVLQNGNFDHFHYGPAVRTCYAIVGAERNCH